MSHARHLIPGKGLRPVLLLLPLLLVTSCGVRRTATESDRVGLPSLSKEEVIRSYSTLRPYPLAEARGTLRVGSEGSSSASAGYRLSLHHKEALVLSVRPMGIFEAARLTLLPDRMILLDRIDSYVVDEPLEGALRAIPDRLLSGLTDLEPARLREMEMTRIAEGYRFTDRREGTTYRLDRQLRLIGMELTLPARAGRLEAAFDRFDSPDGYRPLPRLIELTLTLPSHRPANLILRIDSYDTVPSLRPDTTLPTGYTRIPLQQLLSLLMTSR